MFFFHLGEMHRFMPDNLRNETDKLALKALMSKLANFYMHSFKHTKSILKKLRTLPKTSPKEQRESYGCA